VIFIFYQIFQIHLDIIRAFALWLVLPIQSTDYKENAVRKLVYGLMGALLVLSVGGYLIPDKEEALPGRILMPNVGGRVVFDHKTHMEKYGLECSRCHHEAAMPGGGDSCSACHGRSVAGAFKVSCKSCHAVEFDGDFKKSHVDMSTDRMVCATCHHASFGLKEWDREAHARYVDEDYFQNKAEEAAKAQLSVKDAGHAQCVDCHSREMKGDAKTCLRCHDMQESVETLQKGGGIDKALTSCSSCHEEEPKKLIPNNMAAYHGSCIGCHKEKGGPVDECAQCHMK